MWPRGAGVGERGGAAGAQPGWIGHARGGQAGGGARGGVPSGPAPIRVPHHPPDPLLPSITRIMERNNGPESPGSGPRAPRGGGAEAAGRARGPAKDRRAATRRGCRAWGGFPSRRSRPGRPGPSEWLARRTDEIFFEKLGLDWALMRADSGSGGSRLVEPGRGCPSTPSANSPTLAGVKPRAPR